MIRLPAPSIGATLPFLRAAATPIAIENGIADGAELADDVELLGLAAAHYESGNRRGN
jgi:hypothetical protein